MAKRRKAEPNRTRQRTKPTTGAVDPGEETLYFHGGAPDLRPGDVLRPASALGFAFTYHQGDATYDPAYVYFTPQIEIATAYAARCVLPYVNEIPGDVYRVQPLGPIEPDPDYGPLPEIYKRAPRARILEVVRTEVALTDREQFQLEAPWLHWGSLDLPMYDVDGFMIPSAEMRSNGVTAEHTRIYGPWLPPGRIHPEGFYFPTPQAREGGYEAVGPELLGQVPDLDSPDHQVKVNGNYGAEGRGVSYQCVCGVHRRGPDGPSPTEHQLGERLLELITIGYADEGERLMMIEALARAAATRSPDRWRWFTPTPVVLAAH